MEQKLWATVLPLMSGGGGCYGIKVIANNLTREQAFAMTPPVEERPDTWIEEEDHPAGGYRTEGHAWRIVPAEEKPDLNQYVWSYSTAEEKWMERSGSNKAPVTVKESQAPHALLSRWEAQLTVSKRDHLVGDCVNLDITQGRIDTLTACIAELKKALK